MKRIAASVHHPATKRRKLNNQRCATHKVSKNYNTRVIDVDNIESKESDYCIEIKQDGLDLEYYPNFYSKQESHDIFNTLEQSVEYLKDEDASIMIYGKRHKIPRKQTSFGAIGTSYKFCGKNVIAKRWDKCSILLDIKHKIEKHLLLKSSLNNNNENNLKNKFNFVLLNRYKDGNDYMGFHRDNESDIKKHSSIASISFGAERDIIFKHEDIISHRNKNKTKNNTINLGIKIVKLKLQNGSLLIMRYPTNETWYHQIPKRTQVKDVRINLTYRNMIQNMDT
eukprot:270265_1